MQSCVSASRSPIALSPGICSSHHVSSLLLSFLTASAHPRPLCFTQRFHPPFSSVCPLSSLPSACRADALAPCAPRHAFPSVTVTVLWVLSKCQPLPAWSAVLGDILLSDLRISGHRGGCAYKASAPSLTTCRPEPAQAPFLPGPSHCQTEVGQPMILDCPPELNSISAPGDQVPAKWPSCVVVAGLVPADFHHSLNTNSRKRSLPQLASLFPLADPPVPWPGSRRLHLCEHLEFPF